MSDVNAIMPSIGRVVWYWPGPDDFAMGYIHTSKQQPLAAIVAFVHDTHMVNLTVFDSHGRQFPKQNVRLVQPGDTKWPSDGYCEWMPYQIQQAEKHSTDAS